MDYSAKSARKSCLFFRFVFLSVGSVLFPAFGHQGSSEDTSWSKQENGRAAVGFVCSVHAVRPTIVARSSAKGRDVQKQAQARPCAGFYGPTRKNVVGIFGRGTREPWRL